MRPRLPEPEKKAVTRGVSVPPAIYAHAEQRVGELYPIVKNFSAYVQLLIELDSKNKYIEQAFSEGKLPGRSDQSPRVRKLRAGLQN
jgi:hypothetical protein